MNTHKAANSSSRGSRGGGREGRDNERVARDPLKKTGSKEGGPESPVGNTLKNTERISNDWGDLQVN